MALGSKLFKVRLNVSDLNRNFYEDFQFTLAKHPSEKEDRMMFRLLAFCYCAHPDLELSLGLNDTEAPEIWQKNLMGDIIHWIELGQPTEKRLKQAASKSQKVSVFTYQPSKAKEWLSKLKQTLERNKKLEVVSFNVSEPGLIEKLVNKSMELNCLIQDNMIYLGDENDRVGVGFERIL